MTDQAQLAKQMTKLRIRTKMVDDAQERPTNQNVAKETTEYPVVPRAEATKNVGIQTDMFEIDINRKLNVFQYRVKGFLEFRRQDLSAKPNGRPAESEFTRPWKEEVRNVENLKIAEKVFGIRSPVHLDQMPLDNRSSYDGGNTMFMLNQTESVVNTCGC